MVVLKDKEEEEVVDKVAEMVAEHHFFADWSPCLFIFRAIGRLVLRC